jgi:hypothetical protein
MEGYELFVSKDKGESWKSLCKIEAGDYPLAVVSEKEMYGARRGGYLTKCTDGKNWKLFAKPFPESKEEVIGVLVPPGKDYILVVGETETVKCDSSSGKCMGSVELPSGVLPFAPGAALNAPESQMLYFPDTRGDIHKWSTKTEQLTRLYSYPDKEKPHYYCQIVFAPGSKDVIIAAYNNGHIALSTDEGENWKALKPELPFFNIRHVAVTSSHKLVVAGNGTVFTLDLSKVK